MYVGGLYVEDVTGRFPDVADGGRYRYPERPCPVTRISIHHDGATFTFLDKEEELHRIGVTYNWHRNGKRWAGIGYTIYVFPSGRRYLVGSMDTQRAAVGGQNHDMIGICLAGHFDYALPTEYALESVGKLVTALCRHYERALEVRPHSSWGGTPCPGATWDLWGHRCNPVGPFKEFAKTLQRLVDFEEYLEIIGR